MRKTRYLLLFFCLLLFINSVYSTPFWKNDSFDFRKEIIFNNTGSNTLLNIPMYLNVTYESSMQSDYDDLRFYNGSCLSNQSDTLLYEIELSDINQAQLWLNIPTFVPGENSICMYYGNSTIGSGDSGTSVWKSNFDIVYHMNSGGLDSTSNSNNRVSDVGSPTQNNSILGYGLSFDGNDAWDMANLAYWEALFTQRTHEVIFRTSSDVTTRQTLLAEGGGTNGVSMYIVSGQLYSRWWSESSPNWPGDHLNVSLNANETYHIVMSITYPGNYSLYLNGEQIDTDISPDQIDGHPGNGGIAYTGSNSKDFHDGTGISGTYFEGTMYEFRTYTVDEGVAWYKEVYQNTLNHTSNTQYGVEEEYIPNLTISLTSPNIFTIYPIRQNKTFQLDVNLSCYGRSTKSCGNLSTTSRYNASSLFFFDIQTSAFLPIWSQSTNPQYCELFGGQSCLVSYTLNATGELFSSHKIRVLVSSNDSRILNQTSQNLTVQIIQGNIVGFNQTNAAFNPFDKNSGNSTLLLNVSSLIGNNTNITITCSSGNCLDIMTNFSNGVNLSELESREVYFYCSDSTSGSYSAQYQITSNEYSSFQSVDITCIVNPIFGPISVDLLNPNPLITTNITANSTFTISANISCIGTCGTISGYVIYSNVSVLSWWNSTYSSRKQISINSVTNISLINFPAILSIQYESEMQSDYDDLRFINGNCSDNSSYTELDYELDYSNSSHAFVWVKFPVFNSTQNLFCMYYGNSQVTSGENSERVWSENFELVHHFSQSGTTDRLDSTNNSYDSRTKNYEGDEDVSSLIGRADSFDGTNDYLAISGLEYTTSGIAETTVCALVRSSSSQLQMIASYDRSEYWRLALRDDYGTNNLGWDTSGGGVDDLMDDTNYTDSNWHYICGWFDSSATFDKRIYVDGEITEEIDGHAGVLTSAFDRFGFIGTGSESDTFDGGTGPDNYLFGDLDEFTISNISRSTQWINQTSQLLLSQSSTVSFSIEENFYSGTLVNTTLDSPFWTTSTQPENCTVVEDGSCILTWSISANTNINTLWNVSVSIESNYSQIAINLSPRSQILIVDLPLIELLSPINRSKIITNGTIKLIYRVSNHNVTAGCNLFIDDVFNQSLACALNINQSLNLTFNPGQYNWFINAVSTGNTLVNSSSQNFYVIYNYSARITKNITHQSGLVYQSNITIQNNVNTLNTSFRVFDFVDQRFTAGSWTPLFLLSNVLGSGIYLGTLYSWNFSTPVIYEISSLYSMQNNASTQNLFIVGFE